MTVQKNRQLLIGLAMSAIACQSPLAAAPLEDTLDQSCWQMLNQVKSEIGTIVDQPTFHTSAYESRLNYRSAPADRPFILNVAIGGPELGGNTKSYWQVSNFMSSPVLQASLATQLIQQCQNVAAITFGMYATDWGAMYGLTNNTQVVPFRPISPPCNTLRWGEYCSP